MGIDGLTKGTPLEDLKATTVQEILKKSVEDVEVSPKYHFTLYGTISELTENLILCSASCVTPSLLNDLNISCVVNVAPELPHTPLHSDDVTYRRIEVLDSGSSRIHPHFGETADLIESVAKSGGRSLVYCVAGVSRSASICLAYLMKYKGFTLLEAYNYVKHRRPKIRPNCGFFKQLIEFEEELFGNSTVQMVYNELVQMEIPSLYDSEYKFVNYIGRKARDQNGRH